MWLCEYIVQGYWHWESRSKESSSPYLSCAVIGEERMRPAGNFQQLMSVTEFLHCFDSWLGVRKGTQPVKNLYQVFTSGGRKPRELANPGRPIKWLLKWRQWCECSVLTVFLGVLTAACIIIVLYIIFIMARPPYVIGQASIFLSCGFFFFLLLFFLTYSQPSEIGYLPYFHTWCSLSVNLECRSEMCCTRLTENTGCKKYPKSRHLGTIAQLCRAVSLQLRHVSTIGKKLRNSNIFLTCPHSMLNLSPLTVEIGSWVWGTQPI